MKTDIICGRYSCEGKLVFIPSDRYSGAYYMCEICQHVSSTNEKACKICNKLYSCACGGNCTEDK